MMFEPLRFVHAANLFLDDPLHVTQPLDDDTRLLIEDAGFLSFNTVIRVCLERKADFLLLTGNTFVERHRSLRARVALLNGLRQLGDAGVPVFVVPGRHDPTDAWRQIPRLPTNVTVCYSGAFEPVVFRKNGQAAATLTNGVYYGDADQFGIRTGAEDQQKQRRPFRIGVLRCPTDEELLFDPAKPSDTDEEEGPRVLDPRLAARALAEFLAGRLRDSLVDYTALLDRSTRHTVQFESKVSHSPGRTQAAGRFTDNETGCSLIEVDQTGQIRNIAVATAAIRWKSFRIKVSATTTFDELLNDMRGSVRQTGLAACEQLWLLDWTIEGSGQVFDSLAAESVQQTVIERFAKLKAVSNSNLKCVHAFRLLPALAELSADFPMVAEYFDLLQEQLPVDATVLSSLLDGSELDDARWLDQFRTLIPELDHELVAGHARSLGIRWFGSVREEGSAA